MFYKYSEVKDIIIEKNASQAPVENSVRCYELELLEHYPKGLKVRYKDANLILQWEDILFIAMGSVKISYYPPQILMDFFIRDFRGSFRIMYDNIVFVGFPFRLYGSVYQNIETFVDYILSKNLDIRFDSNTVNFLRELKKERKKPDDLLELISQKPPELHEFKSLLEYEKFIWRDYLEYEQKAEIIQKVKSETYCLILKNYPESKKREIIESIAIIKKISEDEAKKILTLPMVLTKNIPKEEAESILKELKYLDLDIRLLTMDDFKKIRNLKSI